MKPPTTEMIAAARNQAQRERLTAWKELGTAAKAMNACGCSRSSMYRAKKAACKKLGIELEIGCGLQEAGQTGKTWDSKLGDKWLMRPLGVI